MNLKFKDKKISGILTILPQNEIKFEDEIGNYNFSAAQSMKLKLAMGYNSHRIVKDNVCSSDLCIHGLNYLFENGILKPEDIDAIILVTQSPDYIMPPTSYLVHGHFNLKKDMICIDINQGCAGFIIGLIQAFSLLDQESINKVVLLNVDILSQKVSRKDRNSNPLIGDGASVTIIEKSATDTTIHGNIQVDGTGATALMIPAGGFKLPSSSETAILEQDASGNFRSKDNLVMKGDEVFSFVQQLVPPMIENLLVQGGIMKDTVDYYMFHQPNRFMLQKLADKIGIPHDKMPSNIVGNFGNSSGVTIPTAITFNLGDKLLNEELLLCMAGFGVGLTWGSLLMRVGNLDFCKIIEFN
jgi:3-oxoacyl-[acyl-carrier-protein] synthase-3